MFNASTAPKIQRREEKQSSTALPTVTMAKVTITISGAHPTLLSLFLLLCLTGNTNFVPVTEAIWLTIPNTGTKCVAEEISNNNVVLADYLVIDEKNPGHHSTIAVKVTSPYGNNVHHNENVTHGEFAFTTSEAGTYLACFWKETTSNQPDGDLTLSLDWKIGIAAKDWDSVAKKEHIEGVELRLRKLAEIVKEIQRNLVPLKFREDDMRIVNERTNVRVARFSIVSIGICIVVSAVQIIYLKRYFRKKRLI